MPRPDLTLYQWRQGHARLVKDDAGRLSVIFTDDRGREERKPVENPWKLITSLIAHAEESERALMRVLYTHEDTFADDHDEAITAGHDLLNRRTRSRCSVAAPAAPPEPPRRWVKVVDGLPPVGHGVLVYTITPEGGSGHRCIFSACHRAGEWTIFGAGGDPVPGTITHWQEPPPEPETGGDRG